MEKLCSHIGSFPERKEYPNTKVHQLSSHVYSTTSPGSSIWRTASLMKMSADQ